MADPLITAGPRVLADLVSTTEVTALAGLRVSRAAGTFATMSRVVLPVQAGDVLDVQARARVTNDLGYTVGLGCHLWAYDVDDGQDPATRPWWRIGRSSGDNVEPQRHHLPLCLHDVYPVPESWPGGHRIVVVFRVDAHSTVARSGDLLSVDDLGVLTVRRWAKP